MPDLHAIIADAVADPNAFAVVAETELSPTSGFASAIAPAGYAGAERGVPTFAVSPLGFIPAADENGWLVDVARDAEGTPREGNQVIVNSVAAESGRAETALWVNQERVGIQLPGIVIEPASEALIVAALKKAAVSEDSPLAADLRRAVTVDIQNVNTWTLAHRQVDAWVKFALDPSSGKQIWAGGSIRRLIENAGPDPADDLFTNFPNACEFGFWLSAGVAKRIPQARAYSSEIIGYDARPVVTAATKLDPVGGAPKATKVRIKDGQLTLGSGKEPSRLGFGQVPTSPQVHGYVCAPIVQHSAISLGLLRRLRFADDADGQRWRAATTVLILLGMLGRSLANEDLFLRSGCSLVPLADRWGLRVACERSIAPLGSPSIDELANATQTAIEQAAAQGLAFRPSIKVEMSPEQVGIVLDRVKTDREKQELNED